MTGNGDGKGPKEPPRFQVIEGGGSGRTPRSDTPSDRHIGSFQHHIHSLTIELLRTLARGTDGDRRVLEDIRGLIEQRTNLGLRALSTDSKAASLSVLPPTDGFASGEPSALHMEQDMTDAPFTPKTLAERWGCSRQHIHNLIKQGKLKGFRLGCKLVPTAPSATTGSRTRATSKLVALSTAKPSAPTSLKRGREPNI